MYMYVTLVVLVIKGTFFVFVWYGLFLLFHVQVKALEFAQLT